MTTALGVYHATTVRTMRTTKVRRENTSTNLSTGKITK
jgi:hypothetical protein